MWCHLLLVMPVAGLGLFAVLPLSIALPAYLVLSAVSLLVYWSTFQAMNRPVTTGPESMIGARAAAVTDLSPTGLVRYRGELWQAVAGEPIPAGSRVTIVSVDGMRVQVRPAS
ncbi:MAG: NfeD family protein [Anaerolineae bacterium]